MHVRYTPEREIHAFPLETVSVRKITRMLELDKFQPSSWYYVSFEAVRVV